MEAQIKRKYQTAPAQTVPFPRYPELHVQKWDPAKLLQTALGLQESVPNEHSSISVEENKSCKLFFSKSYIPNMRREYRQSMGAQLSNREIILGLRPIFFQLFAGLW